MYTHARPGACSPRKIKCSEITSEGILGQKQSMATCMAAMARRVLMVILGRPYILYMLAKLTSNFYERRY